MRFGMMGIAATLMAATAGMAHGERESGKSWSVAYYSVETPIVLAQAAMPSSTGSSAQKADYLFTRCYEIPVVSASTSAERIVDVPQALANYLEKKSKQPIDIATIKVSMVENTQHGKLVELSGQRGEKAWRYDHEPEYLGKELAVFMAEYGGKRYRIEVTIYANDFYAPPSDPEYCLTPDTMQKLNSLPSAVTEA